MRVLNSAIILLGALSVVAAGPHGGPPRGSHDGSLARPPRHVRGSGSGEPPKKHGCHFPRPQNGSFSGSFDGSRGPRPDGSHRGGPRGGGPRRPHNGSHSHDGSHERPPFDCDDSASADDGDSGAVSSVLSTSGAMTVGKTMTAAASAVAAVAVYLLI